VAKLTGYALPPQVTIHLDSHPALPPLDLAGVTPGQHRAVVALLSSLTGHTYAETADALGIRVGSLHRHLSRLKAAQPALYAAMMLHRVAQPDARHEASQGRRTVSRAAYRAIYRQRFVREPWERCRA
jgi:hypothetical protein